MLYCAWSPSVRVQEKVPFSEMTQWQFPGYGGALTIGSSSVSWQGAYITKPTETYRWEGPMRGRVSEALKWLFQPFLQHSLLFLPPSCHWQLGADMVQNLGALFFSSGFLHLESSIANHIDLLKKKKTRLFLLLSYLLLHNILPVAERHSPMNVQTTKPVALTPVTLTRSTPPYGQYTSSR